MTTRTANQPLPARTLPRMPQKNLTLFFVLTFMLTWGLAMLMIPFSDQIIAIFGEINNHNPLVMVAIYSPGIVGLFLVLRQYGLRGLGSYLRRLTLYRAPLAWWLFLLLGMPAVVFAGAAIKGTLGTTFSFSPWTSVFPALLTALFLGPLEEFGWRGVALPLLQRKFAPFWAGLILGIAWALWHLPSLLLSGMVQSSWDAAPYLLAIIAMCIVLVPFFNASRGSLLIAVLYHFQMMNPIFPDAQPYDNLLFIAVAVVIVILNRKTMFTRTGAVTDVLMPGDEAAR